MNLEESKIIQNFAKKGHNFYQASRTFDNMIRMQKIIIS